MKKSISLILCLFLLTIAFPFGVFAKDKGFPSPDVLNGYENLCLAYTFDIESNNNGAKNENFYKPYVAYYDQDKKPVDYFFDSFLFLPCNRLAPSGASMHRNDSKPTRASDWISYVNDTFKDGYNVSALNAAMGKANESLKQNRKAGVYFTILYPSKGKGKTFGELNGEKIDMTTFEGRKKAVKWIIDEQIKKFKEGNFTNLENVGFYWLEEYLDETEVGSDEYNIIKYASDYLHSLGLKFIWIPYHWGTGYYLWETFGFDTACYQPNMMWQNEPEYELVDETLERCKKYGIGMEIEMDGRIFGDRDHYLRYIKYLEGGMTSGAMNSIKMYYQDVSAYYNAYVKNNPVYRSVYDLTYKYASATLTAEDIAKAKTDAKAYFADLPAGYDWVSMDKSYKSSRAYTAGNDVPYKDISGTELTDGDMASSDLGSEWHAFHDSMTDRNKKYSVTIDLGDYITGISCFAAQFEDAEEYSIGLPTEIKVYASNNGKDFLEIAELTNNNKTKYPLYMAKTDHLCARYIKLEMDKGPCHFVFCSEFAVGAKDGEKGDVSGNGKTDASDYGICKRICLNTYNPDNLNLVLMNADINHDGFVNAKDYSILKRVVLGTYTFND